MYEQFITGLFTIAGVIVGLFFEPAVLKRAKAKELKVVYREFVRLRIKQFFADFKGVCDQLTIIARGGVFSFHLAEETSPLTAMIRDNLNSLKPKEIVTVALTIGKEQQMASRRRTLNTRIEQIRQKKMADSGAPITNELQEIKDEFLAYLKRCVEYNVLLYQALEPLGVDAYLYLDGKRRSHENALSFWRSVLTERDAPYDAAELAPYEPHGYREAKQQDTAGWRKTNEQ